MDRIHSPEQYDQLIERAEREGCGLTNCFFLPSVVQRKIDAGTLFWQDVANGLVLLDENDGFYRCYYYLSADKSPEPVALDADAVIEFPFNGEMNDRQRRQVGLIEGMGFRLGRESGMMSAPAEKVLPAGEETSTPCCVAEGRDTEGIMALLKACFNPLYAFLPDGEALRAMIEGGRVWVVRDGDRVAAALLSDFEKRIASVNQVAVDPADRRKGYGRSLMRAYHRYYAGCAASFRHWVDVNNAPAVRMYQDMGYDFSLRRANEYILLQRRENEK